MGMFGIPNKQKEPVRQYNTSFQEKVEAQQQKEAEFLFGEEKEDEAQI
jgi:hypothetical protein